MRKTFFVDSTGLVILTKKGWKTVPAAVKGYDKILSYVMSDAYDEQRFEEVIAGGSTGNTVDVLNLDALGTDEDGTVGIKTDSGLVTLTDEAVDKLRKILREGPEAVARVSRFLRRCQCNPCIESLERLCEWISRHNLSITDEGYFYAFKSVDAQYKDHHSGTFDNSPNRVVTMSRDDVVLDPYEHCAAGLHVASYDYARSFRGCPRLMLVAVDPSDVVSVPTDCECAKIRVCRYTVLQDITELAGKYGEEFSTDPRRLQQRCRKDAEWGKDELALLSKYGDNNGITTIAGILHRSVKECEAKYRECCKAGEAVVKTTNEADVKAVTKVDAKTVTKPIKPKRSTRIKRKSIESYSDKTLMNKLAKCGGVVAELVRQLGVPYSKLYAELIKRGIIIPKKHKQETNQFGSRNARRRSK